MSIASLKSANKTKNAKIRILERYSTIFQNKKSNFKPLYTTDKNICDSPSFWKGEIYEDFKELAEDGLRREGYRYYKSFDNIEKDIQSKIKSLEKEIDSNNDKIKELQRQQKG